MPYVATLMFEQGNGVDLSRLNEAERQVLRLLAEGHTAKSVANELGSTPTAVNERLREARRKTGAGSSRELARLLKSQENGPEEMGVAFADVPALSAAMGASTRRSSKGLVPVTIGTLAVIGSAAIYFAPQTSTSEPSRDPIYGDVLAERDPEEMFKDVESVDAAKEVLVTEGSASLLRRRYAQVRSETKDTVWAEATEKALKAAFSEIPHVGVPGTQLRVECGATLCEVVGTIDVSFAETEQAAIDELSRATAPRLNPSAMKARFARMKVRPAGWVQSSTKDPKPKPMFLAYFAREK